MAKRILVPLDQSVEAEGLVPLVADLARGAGASVRLLHVAAAAADIVGADGRLLATARQETERREAEAMDYLQTVELALEGVPVESAVRLGDPVAGILAEARAWGADLIALSTSRRAPGRLAPGTVAERVFRTAAAPVVLFRREAGPPPPA